MKGKKLMLKPNRTKEKELGKVERVWKKNVDWNIYFKKQNFERRFWEFWKDKYEYHTIFNVKRKFIKVNEDTIVLKGVRLESITCRKYLVTSEE